MTRTSPVSTTAVPTPHSRPGDVQAVVPRPGDRRLLRLAGLVVKIVLLAVVNALAVWAATVLADKNNWPALGMLAIVDAADRRDLPRAEAARLIPLKFLVPGTVFLVAFQIAPVLYTVNVAFTNYSTGHILSKAAAITGIKVNSLRPPESGTTYAMAPARDKNGKLVLILWSRRTARRSSGTTKGLTPIPRADVRSRAARSSARAGYTRAGEGAGADRASELTRLPRAARRGRGDPAAGPRHRGPRCSRPCATTRARPVRADLRRRGVPRQRARLLRRRAEGRARAGLEDPHRAPQLQPGHPRPADPQAVPPGLRSGRSSSPADRAPLVRARPLPGDRARQAGAARSSASTARSSSSPTRSRRSSRCSSGTAC